LFLGFENPKIKKQYAPIVDDKANAVDDKKVGSEKLFLSKNFPIK